MMRHFMLLALAALAGCSDRSGRQAADPRIADASRPLVFLTNPEEPPCSYVDASGQIAGSDVALARRIAAKMGRKLAVEGVPFPRILPRLREGTADFAISTITITEARRRDVDFSEPYKSGGGCFLYHAKGRRPRMSQLASLRVGVETDSSHDLYLCFHGCDPVRFDGLADSIAALEKGEIDAVFFDAIQLKSYAERSGGRLAVTPQVTREFYGVAVDKRRPDVLAAANAVIAGGGAE